MMTGTKNMHDNAAPREEKYAVLKKTRLFSSLEGDLLSKSLSLFKAETACFPRGSFLLNAGEPVKRFGLVLSGAIKVTFDDIDGNRTIMANVTPGGTFGESLCFLKATEAPCSIYAAENSEVMFLSLDLLFESNDDPLNEEMRKRFISMLAERTLSMNDRIQILCKLSLREKLITFFSQQVNAHGAGTFSISMDRADMASYIGVNRSALSRELSAMKKEGIIDYYKDSFRILKNKFDK